MTLTSGAEEMRTITASVIAHDALGFDAEGSEVSQRALEEEDRAVLTFIGHDLSEAQAMSLSVNGFVNDLVRQFPMEYSVELKRLIELEMEGSVG